MSQKPSVGRIVHYLPYGAAAPLAAIITRINEDETVNLTVFASDQIGAAVMRFTYVSEGEYFGQWSWPPRV